MARPWERSIGVCLSEPAAGEGMEMLVEWLQLPPQVCTQLAEGLRLVAPPPVGPSVRKPWFRINTRGCDVTMLSLLYAVLLDHETTVAG